MEKYRNGIHIFFVANKLSPFSEIVFIRYYNFIVSGRFAQTIRQTKMKWQKYIFGWLLKMLSVYLKQFRVPWIKCYKLFDPELLCRNLAHCDLVTPYGKYIYLSHQWLSVWLDAWRHQDITWTNIDLLSLLFSGIHPKQFTSVRELI